MIFSLILIKIYLINGRVPRICRVVRAAYNVVCFSIARLKNYVTRLQIIIMNYYFKVWYFFFDQKCIVKY